MESKEEEMESKEEEMESKEEEMESNEEEMESETEFDSSTSVAPSNMYWKKLCIVKTFVLNLKKVAQIH